MKVAFVLNAFPVLSETFVLHQIVGLLDKGVEVDLLVTMQAEEGVWHPVVGDRGLADLVRRVECLPPRRLRRILNLSRLYRMAGDGAGRRQLLKALNPALGRDALSLQLVHDVAGLLPATRYDVVHCQFGNLLPRVLNWMAVGALMGPLVLSLRGNDTSVLARHLPGRLSRMFSQVSLCLPVCEFLAGKARALGCPEEKIQVLPSGMEPAAFPFNARRRGEGEPLRLLSVGRLVAKKGLTFGLRSVNKLSSAGVPVEYTIVGDGPLRGVLEEEAVALGLSSRVTFTGAMTSEGTRDLYCRSHVLLAPCVTAPGGDVEGIPNVLKEAMACGMPVVATRHAGIPELVEDGVNGILVGEGDAEGLAKAVRWLLDHPEGWEAMGHAGRRCVEETFSIEPLNDRLLTLYREMGD